MAREQAWRVLALYATDGTQMTLQDIDSNESAFGRLHTGKDKVPAVFSPP